MELLVASGIGLLDRRRRLPAAAGAHLLGGAGPDAAVLCGQPVHLRDGPAGRPAPPPLICAGEPASLCRPAAAGAGADRHRDQLRHDRLRGRAGAARRGTRPAATMSTAARATRPMNAPGSSCRCCCRRWRRRCCCCCAAVAALAARGIALRRRVRGAGGDRRLAARALAAQRRPPGLWRWATGRRRSASCSWPDRLSAMMLVLTAVIAPAGAAACAATAGTRRGRAFPPAVPVAAAGHQRRLPDRRPVQPVRLLRGAADRLLRAAAAWRRRGAAAAGPALRRDQPAGSVAVPDRARPAVRRSPAR